MDGINKCVEDGSTELVKVALSQSARNEVRSICNNNGCQTCKYARYVLFSKCS